MYFSFLVDTYTYANVLQLKFVYFCYHHGQQIVICLCILYKFILYTGLINTLCCGRKLGSARGNPQPFVG